MVKIRLLQDSDEAEWFRLRCALWPTSDTISIERTMTRIRTRLDRHPVFVAEQPDGSLCGMLELSIRARTRRGKTHLVAYIEAWFVDAEWRRQGVGRKLVEAAEGLAQARGCVEIASDTSAHYPLGPPAHESLGFEEAKRRFHYRKHLAPGR